MLEELWSAYPSLTELTIRSTLASFRFVGDDVFKSVSVLSGGERARLTLAKLLLSDMNLLILDEPTNHLDIASREALEEALLGFDGTIITVSHDRYFIDKLATRIIDIVPPSEGKCRDFAVTNIGEGYSELSRERERLALLNSTDIENKALLFTHGDILTIKQRAISCCQAQLVRAEKTAKIYRKAQGRSRKA